MDFKRFYERRKEIEEFGRQEQLKYVPENLLACMEKIPGVEADKVVADYKRQMQEDKEYQENRPILQPPKSQAIQCVRISKKT